VELEPRIKVEKDDYADDRFSVWHSQNGKHSSGLCELTFNDLVLLKNELDLFIKEQTND